LLNINLRVEIISSSRRSEGRAMENVISMKNVLKDFGGVRAIKQLTLDVPNGEIFGFLGPSGAGKTTTIKIATGQLVPSGGEVRIFGKPILTNKNNAFQHIGVLSDNSGVYERLSVYDNLALFADIYGVSHKRIDEVLARVGLGAEKAKQAKKLSKGMRQRLMIARAVLHKPQLLFLDEPTASLDPGTMLEIHKLLRQLNSEGMTIFLTTHNMEEADKLCHRVAFLNAGEIVEMDSPENLKLKYANDAIRVLVGESRRVEIVGKDLAGGQKIKTWLETGQLVSIHSMEPNLEEIFLKLTGRAL